MVYATTQPRISKQYSQKSVLTRHAETIATIAWTTWHDLPTVDDNRCQSRDPMRSLTPRLYKTARVHDGGQQQLHISLSRPRRLSTRDGHCPSSECSTVPRSLASHRQTSHTPDRIHAVCDQHLSFVLRSSGNVSSYSSFGAGPVEEVPYNPQGPGWAVPDPGLATSSPHDRP